MAPKRVDLDSSGVRTALAAEYGLSHRAVAYILRGRTIKSKAKSDAQLQAARGAVERFLDSAQNVSHRGKSETLHELAAAQRRRRIDRVLKSLAEADVDAKLSSDQHAVVVNGKAVPIPPVE